MDLATTILATAKAAQVSGALLFAICSHESNGFKMNYAPNDKGSPSIGSCQIKEATARMIGFKGLTADLMKPSVNVYWAAKYLAYQQVRYGEDSWVKLAAAYNAGSYIPSKKKPGCPVNLKYVIKVQAYLEDDLKSRLVCGQQYIAYSRDWN